MHKAQTWKRGEGVLEIYWLLFGKGGHWGCKKIQPGVLKSVFKYNFSKKCKGGTWGAFKPLPPFSNVQCSSRYGITTYLSIFLSLFFSQTFTFSLFLFFIPWSLGPNTLFISTFLLLSLRLCLVLLLQLKYKSFLLRSFLQVNRERLKMFDKLKIKKQFFKKTFVNNS
jgi:hypothetical protein